jgi:hypothetical protein
MVHCYIFSLVVTESMGELVALTYFYMRRGIVNTIPGKSNCESATISCDVRHHPSGFILPYNRSEPDGPALLNQRILVWIRE